MLCNPPLPNIPGSLVRPPAGEGGRTSDPGLFGSFSCLGGLSGEGGASIMAIAAIDIIDRQPLLPSIMSIDIIDRQPL